VYMHAHSGRSYCQSPTDGVNRHAASAYGSIINVLLFTSNFLCISLFRVEPRLLAIVVYFLYRG
jgi:hypothetical protein